MRIWGYLLIVLNIGAAGAFVYFGMEVWKARSEWQFALLKQELVNRGLPLEAPDEPPDDLDEDSAALSFNYGASNIDRITNKQLARLIPAGGKVLGFKGTKPIANQTAEVKRVEEIVFKDLDGSSREPKRIRLLVQLLNLAKSASLEGTGREGVWALLRDFPDDNRRAIARRELPFIGRSEPQVQALQAVEAVGAVHAAFTGPNVSPEDKALLSLAGRRRAHPLGEGRSGQRHARSVAAARPEGRRRPRQASRESRPRFSQRGPHCDPA